MRSTAQNTPILRVFARRSVFCVLRDNLYRGDQITPYRGFFASLRRLARRAGCPAQQPSNRRIRQALSICAYAPCLVLHAVAVECRSCLVTHCVVMRLCSCIGACATVNRQTHNAECDSRKRRKPATSAGLHTALVTGCVPPPPPRGSPLAAAGLVWSTTILYIYLAKLISAGGRGEANESGKGKHGAKQRQWREQVNRIKDQQGTNTNPNKYQHRQPAKKAIHPTPPQPTATPYGDTGNNITQ